LNLDFELHYQPIFHVHSLNEPLGYEALLRPRSRRSPLEALQAAAKQNFIDMWELLIIERAVDEVLARESCMAFINLSGTSFLRRDFIAKTERTLQSRGVAASRICIEISERQVTECGFLSTIIDDWVERGFYVALDDFGAGASNFDVLMNCRLDYVKVDRILINGIAQDISRQRLLSGIVETIARRSICPIFEGVERHEDLQWLLDKGWDAGIQGFALAKPAPLGKERDY